MILYYKKNMLEKSTGSEHLKKIHLRLAAGQILAKGLNYYYFDPIQFTLSEPCKLHKQELVLHFFSRGLRPRTPSNDVKRSGMNTGNFVPRPILKKSLTAYGDH